MPRPDTEEFKRLRAAIERIDPEELSRRIQEARKTREQHEADERNLTGAFEPAHGVCSVCTGEVVPNKAQDPFPSDAAFGVTVFLQTRVTHWYCADCGLMYHHVPKRALDVTADEKPAVTTVKGNL
jgi:hypothetical protein